MTLMIVLILTTALVLIYSAIKDKDPREVVKAALDRG